MQGVVPFMPSSISHETSIFNTKQTTLIAIKHADLSFIQDPSKREDSDENLEMKLDAALDR